MSSMLEYVTIADTDNIIVYVRYHHTVYVIVIIELVIH